MTSRSAISRFGQALRDQRRDLPLPAGERVGRVRADLRGAVGRGQRVRLADRKPDDLVGRVVVASAEQLVVPVLSESGARRGDRPKVVVPDERVTTVDQPREQGTIAVRLLVERIEGRRDEPRHILVAPSLVVRSTTAPP